jgi:hypothetical protein
MKQLMFHDDSAFWFETLRNLGLAVYGGSDVGDVVATGSQVTSGDYDGWTTPGCPRPNAWRPRRVGRPHR